MQIMPAALGTLVGKANTAGARHKKTLPMLTGRACLGNYRY